MAHDSLKYLHDCVTHMFFVSLTSTELEKILYLNKKIFNYYYYCDFKGAFNIFVVIFCSFTSLSSYQTAMSSNSQIDASKLSEVDKLLEGNDDDKIRARDLLLNLLERVSTNNFEYLSIIPLIKYAILSRNN